MQLSDGEHVLFQGHPSWRSTLTYYLQGLVAVVALAAVVAGISYVSEDEVKTNWVVPAVLVLLALVIVAGYVKRIATTYTITNRRLHIKRGIVARRTQEARLERVQNVNTDQTVLERMLRVGTVDFDTAGGDDHDFKFSGVADPLVVVQRVDEAQREHAIETTEPGGAFGGRPIPGAGL
jgi:uncharacterized membrane protein YdbT with pleckstrin-like domain